MREQKPTPETPEHSPREAPSLPKRGGETLGPGPSPPPRSPAPDSDGGSGGDGD